MNALYRYEMQLLLLLLKKNRTRSTYNMKNKKNLELTQIVTHTLQN